MRGDGEKGGGPTATTVATLRRHSGNSRSAMPQIRRRSRRHRSCGHGPHCLWTALRRSGAGLDDPPLRDRTVTLRALWPCHGRASLTFVLDADPHEPWLAGPGGGLGGEGVLVWSGRPCGRAPGSSLMVPWAKGSGWGGPAGGDRGRAGGDRGPAGGDRGPPGGDRGPAGLPWGGGGPRVLC